MNSSDDFCIERKTCQKQMSDMQSICNLEIEPKTKHVQIYLHPIKRKRECEEKIGWKKKKI